MSHYLDDLPSAAPAAGYRTTDNGLRADAEKWTAATKRLTDLLADKDQRVPLPLDVLPPRTRAMVEGYHNVFGSANEHYVAAIISAVAATIGKKIQIEHKRQRHLASFYTCIVAYSGTGKSPVLKTVFKPLTEHAEQILKDFKFELDQWHEECGELKKNEPTPPRPQAKRPVVSSVTLEKLYQLLVSTPNGIMIYRDELKGWFGAMNQYKQGGDEYEFFLQAADGLPWYVDRKNEDAPIALKDFCLNLAGGTQPGVLRSIASKENRDSGMLHRFIFAFPDSQLILDDHDHEPHPDHDERWNSLIKMVRSVRMKQVRPTKGPSFEVPHVVRLNKEAKAVFRPYFNALQQRFRAAHAQEDDNLMASISKYRSRVLRLALVLHVMHWAEAMVEGGWNANDPAPADWLAADNMEQATKEALLHDVTAATMQHAVALALYFEDASVRVLNQTGNPVDALKPKERAWYLSLPEKGARKEAIDLGKKAGMSQRTIDRKLKERKDLFRYADAQYEKRSG